IMLTCRYIRDISHSRTQVTLKGLAYTVDSVQNVRESCDTK
ncbi:7818_t:CDS:1, partial [Gigaspora margarita]